MGGQLGRLRVAVAVGVLFENRFEQVLIEFMGGIETFTDGEDAMEWVLGRT